jgi:hypothetical protein
MTKTRRIKKVPDKEMNAIARSVRRVIEKVNAQEKPPLTLRKVSDFHGLLHSLKWSSSNAVYSICYYTMLSHTYMHFLLYLQAIDKTINGPRVMKKYVISYKYMIRETSRSSAHFPAGEKRPHLWDVQFGGGE